MQVYDILGKEITTLVDEYKPVENYEVEFNSANERSGVILSMTCGIFSLYLVT